MHITEARANAGRFRSENEGGVRERPLIHEVPVRPEVIQKIKELIGNQKQELILLATVPTRAFSPQIDGVPAVASPRYFILGKRIRYEYPAPKFLKIYLQEMKKSFDQIYESLHQSSPDRDAALKALAHYYHLSMIGHPFQRANNSLVMAQVNTTLKLLGLKPVFHGELDFVVRSLDSAEAENEFLNYVWKNQGLGQNPVGEFHLHGINEQEQTP